MKLSVITVNYNNYEGLKKTMASVIKQTFVDFEWIVIDGGSTDGSKELIDQHSNLFAYYCCERDNGIYHAMNKGVKHAHGEYVHFLNSGDWLCNDYTYESLFKTTITCDILYGRVAIIKPDGTVIEGANCPTTISLSFFRNNTLNHQNTLIRTSLLTEYPYDEKLKICSDYKSYLTLCLLGKKFCYCNSFIAYYEENGLSSNNKSLLESESNTIWNELVNNNIQKDIVQLLEYREIDHFVHHRKSIYLLFVNNLRLCKRVDWLLEKLERLQRR